MINNETNTPPESLVFDLAIVPVGYEKRCRWIVENQGITAKTKLGLEFGFLQEAHYKDNKSYFIQNGWDIRSIQTQETYDIISTTLSSRNSFDGPPRVFIDISSMSREMMADIAISIRKSLAFGAVKVVMGYAPAVFSGEYPRAPIRLADPLKPSLAGWSVHPEKPLGTLIGLGCEQDLALGALQMLEPNKSWLFSPIGFDSRFEGALLSANKQIEEIFDITHFDYSISDPVITRGRIEALINATEKSFRLVCIPFGPKIFSWLVLSTIIFEDRKSVGIWSFSSKEQAAAIDREVSGEIVWYNATLCVQQQ